ncbi:MAG: DUF4382 domain-containing protein, partial [Bacteroidota bacterium]
MKTLFSSKKFGSILMFGAMLMLAGCGGSSGGGGSSTGTMSLRITDAAVDSADHVYVQFHGVELQAADGKRTTLYYCQDPTDATKTIVSDSACTTPPAPKQIDLLALNGGLADTLLDSFTLPSGHYSWARLMVDTAGTLDSYIVVAGNDFELTIPSGAETGLKVNRGFDVPAGGHADFTIDFDLRKSVVLANGNYMLRPTLRMVDNAMVGAIAGTVDPSLIPSGCTPAVYVFSGAGATPDDIDTDNTNPDPVTTAKVNLTDGTYKAAFLEAGDYTVAYTCDAAADDPAVDNTADNTVTFSNTATVAV